MSRNTVTAPSHHAYHRHAYHRHACRPSYYGKIIKPRLLVLLALPMKAIWSLSSNLATRAAPENGNHFLWQCHHHLSTKITTPTCHNIAKPTIHHSLHHAKVDDSLFFAIIDTCKLSLFRLSVHYLYLFIIFAGRFLLAS